jgi:AbrB family looped-hinge helix DNA binding protein
MDDRGRLADRSPIRAAELAPEQPITISVAHDDRLLIVRAGGPETITRHGYLRLPARVRHALGLAAGDRLLVTVTATPRILTVYPMATVEAILRQSRSGSMSMDAL